MLPFGFIISSGLDHILNILLLAGSDKLCVERRGFELVMSHDFEQNGVVSSSASPLGYAKRIDPPRHSFYSCLSLVMAVVANVWLLYVRSCFGPGPPHLQALGPLGTALCDTFPVPGIISFVLAMAGILHHGRKRTLSYYALALDALVYLLLTPPMNLA